MTKPIRIPTRWQRLARYTVWHPINTDPQDDDRWTARVWLPLYDLLAVGAGLIAFHVGSSLMNRLFPEWLVNFASVSFVVAAAVAFVGVTIPRLWRGEVLGKIWMSFLLTTYAFLVLAYPSGPVSNAFVTVILIMATWGCYPRLTRLFIRGFRARRMAREAKNAAL